MWTWWRCLGVVWAMARARELDPAACAPRFDVQRDKIIRTEESQEMGARYLSELDVGARHECLRLCCETDACDVFVYEEKSPGSCYLFNCGPPEDFRCKFTAHSNFSSGVLAINRRLAELQDQERLSQHEHQLANLRSGTSTTSSSTSTTTMTTRAPPSPELPEPAPQPPEPPLSPLRRCSRYQFECHSGGECIAVYNACDGVPQCADGSDEAPELGCPARAPPAPPRPPAPPVPDNDLTEQMLESAAAAAAARSSERWPPRLAQAQAALAPVPAPAPHRYNEGAVSASSHIFSHKGGLLQEPEPPQYAPFEPPAAWRPRPWSPPRPGGEAEDRAWASLARAPDPRRAWPVPPAPPPDQFQELPVYMMPKTMPEVPLVYSSQQATLRDGPKKGFETLQPRPAPPPTAAPPAPPAPPDRREERLPAPSPPPTPRPHNHTPKKTINEKVTTEARAHVAGVGVSGGGDVTHELLVAGDERDHEGLSEHPPAAVLLLVLGVGMTGALAAAVGCRARAVRRRLRRGKAPFAHDADYLVNGMYL